MNRPDGPLLEIYIGAPITHRSEEKLVRALQDHAMNSQTRIIAFANFEVGGRQFDFVVITDQRVMVVDAKSSAYPVRGEINGSWQRASASGTWAPMTNGYRQVLDQKNLLKSAMPASPPGFFPEAAAVFVDGIPAGSELTEGDFKARVCDLPAFLASMKIPAANPWSFEDWRRWGSKNQLMRVAIEEAFDTKPSEILRAYRERFVAEYHGQAAAWIPEDEQQRSLVEVSLRNSPGVYITGASGCGKTLMTKAAAVALAQSGTVIVYLQGKDIGGTLLQALQTEVALVSDSSFDALRCAVRATGVRFCFILDGVNELPAAVADRTLRGVASLARRFDAQIVASGQHTKPSHFVGLETVTLPAPSASLKERIAAKERRSLSAAALQILSGVRSGLEAKIVGELQDDLGIQVTRGVLIDQYVRKRLGEKSRSLKAALETLAGELFTQLAFSATELAFDGLMLSRGLTDDNCEELFTSGLIERRAGRVSFSHEIFLYGTAAARFSRQATDDPGAVAETLNTAFGEPLSLDVIAGMDDEQAILGVLERLTNSQIIVRVVRGETGVIAASVASKLLKMAVAEINAEIGQLRLAITPEKAVEWVAEPTYTHPQMARFKAIGILTSEGVFVEDCLALCRAMDEVLNNERKRLSGEARDKKIALRSLSFSLAYLGQYGGRRIAFYSMIDALQPQLERRGRSDALGLRTLPDLSSGELYLAVEHARMFYTGWEDAFCEQLTEVIDTRFTTEPYHVQLSILHNAGFVRGASNDAIIGLVAALRRLDCSKFHIFISSAIIDALKHLGALELDAEDSREGIRSEIIAAISGSSDDEACERALGIYIAQFDHPYDWVYYDEVQNLPADERRKLLVRAFNAGSLRQSGSLLWILREIAEFNDPAQEPVFARYARCPENNPMWQDEIGAFALAARFVARHGTALPHAPAGTIEEQCFAALRDIVVAAELETPEAKETAQKAWNRLLSLPPAQVMSSVREIAQEGLARGSYDRTSKVFPPIDLSDVFPSELLALARQFVRNGEPAKSFRGYPEFQATAYACQIVGQFGDRSDLGALRAVMANSAFAKPSLAAIADIEKRK